MNHPNNSPIRAYGKHAQNSTNEDGVILMAKAYEIPPRRIIDTLVYVAIGT